MKKIIGGLGLELSLDGEFAKIREMFENKAGTDYAASRGEYLNGIVMAAYLGFELSMRLMLSFSIKNGALE